MKVVCKVPCIVLAHLHYRLEFTRYTYRTALGIGRISELDLELLQGVPTPTCTGLDTSISGFEWQLTLSQRRFEACQLN